MSRGGLYRHYTSPKEIYVDWLNTETAQSDNSLQVVLNTKHSAKEVLTLFLKNEVKQLSENTGIPDTSIYELCNQYPECIELIEAKTNRAVKRLEKIIELGNEQGCMRCESPRTSAITILAFLQGLGSIQPFAKLLPFQLEQQLQTVCKCLGGDFVC